MNNLNINIIVPIARKLLPIIEKSTIYDENILPQDINEVIDCSNGVTIYQLPEFNPVTKSLTRKKFRLSEILVELQYISISLIQKYKGESIINKWSEDGNINDNKEKGDDEDDEFDLEYNAMIDERKKSYESWNDLENLVPKNIYQEDDIIKEIVDSYTFEELKNCFEYDINLLTEIEKQNLIKDLKVKNIFWTFYLIYVHEPSRISRYEGHSYWNQMDRLLIHSMYQISDHNSQFIYQPNLHSAILKLLYSVMQNKFTDHFHINYCINWIKTIGLAYHKTNITEKCEEAYEQCSKILYKMYKRMRYAIDPDTRLLANDAILFFIDLKGFTEAKFKYVDNIYNIMYNSLNDVSAKVGSDLIKIIQRINPIISINKWSNREAKFVEESDFNECVMASPCNGNFKYEHFELIIRNLNIAGENNDDSDNSNNGNMYETQFENINWLADLYYICQASSVLNTVSVNLANMKGNNTNKKVEAVGNYLTRNKLRFWTIWEMSRYCILSKLKTTFGNAQQTFEFIEHSLNRIWKTKENINNFENLKFLTKTKYLGYLIPFIDILELQIYNAYEGTALEKPPAYTRASSMFFSINSKVCEEWYLRIRKLIILDSKIFGTSSSYVVRHCMHYLSDKISYIKQYSKETAAHLIEYEQVIIELVLALQLLKDPDPIIGIYYWIKKIIIQEMKKNSKKKDNSHLQILLQKKPNGNKDTYQYHLEWILVAALMAENKYEEAVVKYRFFLNKYQEKGSLSPNLISFIIKQIVECYRNLNDWSDVREFLHYVKSVNIENSNYPLCSFENGKNPKLFEAWEDFENNNYHDAYINISKTSPNFRETYESVGMNRAVMNASQYYMLYSMLLINEKNNSNFPVLKSMLNKSLTLVNELLHRLNNTFASSKEMLPALVQLQLIKTIETIGKGSTSSDKNPNILISEINNNILLDKEVTEKVDISILMRMLDIFSFLNNTHVLKDSDYIMKLNYDIAKVARKQGNNILGQKLIQKNLLKINNEFDANDIPSMLIRDNNPIYMKDYIFELAKIYINEKKYDKGFNILLDLIDSELSDCDSDDEDSVDDEEITKFRSSVYLKAISFLTKFSNSDEFDVEEMPEVIDLKISSIANKAEIEEVKGTKRSDVLVQSIYSVSCDESGISPKIWCKAAHYYYLQAQELLEEMELGSVDNIRNSCLYELKKFILGYSEKKVFWSTNRIFNLNQIYGDCLSILTSLFGNSYKIKFENKKLNATEMDYKIRKYLYELFPDLNEELLKELLSILNSIKSVLIGYFTDAVINYFKYLQYFDEFEQDQVKMKKDQEYNVTKIALRLLHVFENYGIYIVRVYREGFANTPISPWEKIIPQLFARLDHPEPFVQDQICSLICRIGIISPHLIVYPAIVGVSTANTSNNSNDTRLLYQNIVDSLIQSGSEMLVKEIQKMINELQQVTVLWEETLLTKLAQLQGETDRRFARLNKENERVNNNNQLSKEEKEEITKNNYLSLLNPVIHIIESFYDEINIEPENEHQKWFHEHYKEMLKNAINNLKNPNNDSFQKTWEPFSLLYKEIAKEVQKNRKILLADVSPYLANIKESKIPLPGIYDKKEIVYIQHFDEYIYTLPTKTKPKRINLFGSDGNVYTYLLKGLEDLHLDERIMQLLSCTNNILKGNKKANTRNLQARNYSVVPLSGHLGMIQWVTNATQMFFLYKKWQQRKYAKEIQNIRNADEHNITFAIRPHEMFYNKLDAQFKKNNMVRGPIRKNWPVNIQRHAFLELRHETPNDLIAKEFWTTSSSPTVWWQKINSYARSLAVMSIIGYIIGLGDRHLDNILIDFDTGEVIHIDYNVCFEKGKKLCVPETVPFRLTQNLQTALGVYGIEGPFRIACETVLSVLRENKEILMTILEAFIYDPLVDWSNDYKKSMEKQMMELNVNIGLLSTRIAGLCPVIKENRELFINNLKSLQHYLKVRLTEISYQDLYKYDKEGSGKESVKDISESIDQSNSASSNILMFSSKSDNSNVKFSSENQILDVVEKEETTLNNKEREFLEYMKEELGQIYDKCESRSQQFQTTYGTLHGTFLHNIQSQFVSINLDRIRIPVEDVIYPCISDKAEIVDRIQDIFNVVEDWNLFRIDSCESYFNHLRSYQLITAPISNGLLNQDYYTNIYKLLSNIFDNGDNRKIVMDNVKALSRFINDRSDDNSVDHDTCYKVANMENLMKNAYYSKYEVLQVFKDNFDENEKVEPEHIDEVVNFFNDTLPVDMKEHSFVIKLILLNYINKYSRIVLDMMNHKEIDLKRFTVLDITRELHTIFYLDIFDMHQVQDFYILSVNIFSLSSILFKVAEIRNNNEATFYRKYYNEQNLLVEFIKSIMKIPQEYLFVFIPQLLRSINDNTIDIHINLIDSIAKQIEKLKQTSDYQNIREIRNQYANIVNNMPEENYNNNYYNKSLLKIFRPVEELLAVLKDECNTIEEKEYYEELEDHIFVLKIKNLDEANKAMAKFYKSMNNNSFSYSQSWINIFDTKVLISEYPAFKPILESINKFINFVVEEICLRLLSTHLKKSFTELFNNLDSEESEECVELEDYVKHSELLMENPKFNNEKYLEIFIDFQESLDMYLKYDIYRYCECCIEYISGFAQINRETYIRYQLLNDYPLLKAREFDDYPSNDKEYLDLEYLDDIDHTTPKTIREQIIKLCSKDIENMEESITRLRAIERSYNEIYNMIDTCARQKLLKGIISREDMEEVKDTINDIKMEVDAFLLSEHQKTNYLIEFASDIILMETTRVDETEETSDINYIISINLKEFMKILSQDNNSPFFSEQFNRDGNISFDAFVNTFVNINDPDAKDTDISDLFYLKSRYPQYTSHTPHESNATNLIDGSHLSDIMTNGTSENPLIMSSDISHDLTKSEPRDENIIDTDFIQSLKNTFDITLKLYRDIQSLTTTALKPAEKIKEPVECIEEVNFVWTEWEIYCQEFVKTVDELETLRSVERVETYLLKRISDLIIAFDAVSAKLMNLQNINNMTVGTTEKRGYNEQHRRQSHHNQSRHGRSRRSQRPVSTPPSSSLTSSNRAKALKSSRSSSSISMKSSLSKDQLASLINEEIDLNNNGSDEMLGSEKEKSSNHDSNDVEDNTDEYNNNNGNMANSVNKDKSLKENYQFTDRNNGDFIQDDMGDTPQGRSIEELDKEISKNNDIIYDIQENIKLSNKVMTVSAYTNENNDDIYSSATNPSAHAQIANAAVVNQPSSTSNANPNIDKHHDSSDYSNEDDDNKESDQSSSPNRPSADSEEDNESVIHSLILQEEVTDVPKINERNLQAMKILYRIRDKLNGYDPQIDPSIMDVTKHVDKVINQAINVDNLACMYEGWTSWI